MVGLRVSGLVRVESGGHKAVHISTAYPRWIWRSPNLHSYRWWRSSYWKLAADQDEIGTNPIYSAVLLKSFRTNRIFASFVPLTMVLCGRTNRILVLILLCGIYRSPKNQATHRSYSEMVEWRVLLTFVSGIPILMPDAQIVDIAQIYLDMKLLRQE